MSDDLLLACCHGDLLVPNGMTTGRERWRNVLSGEHATRTSQIQLLQQETFFKIFVVDQKKTGGQFAFILNRTNYEVKKEDWHEVNTRDGKLYALKFDKNDKHFVEFQAKLKRVLESERISKKSLGVDKKEPNLSKFCLSETHRKDNMAGYALSGREVADAIPYYSSESSSSSIPLPYHYQEGQVSAVPKEPYDSSEEWKYKGGGGTPFGGNPGGQGGHPFSTASHNSKVQGRRSYPAYAPPPESLGGGAPVLSRGGGGGGQRHEEVVHSGPLSTGMLNLIESLQSAIYKGEEEQAGEVAKILASRKANVKMELCQTGTGGKSAEKTLSLKVCVEDKSNSGTSIMLRVRLSMTIKDLKRHMALEHQFPVEVQRWIIGKRLAKDEEQLNKFKQLIHDGSPVYLYLLSAKSVGLPSRQVYERENNLGQAAAAPPTPTTPPQPLPQQRNSVPAQSNVPQTRRPSDTAETVQQRQPQLPQQQLPQQQQRQRQQQQQQQQQAAPPVAQPVVVQQKGWSCSVCTYVNLPMRPGCEMCATNRPENYKVPDNYEPTAEEVTLIARQEELDRQAREADRQMRQRDEDEDQDEHLVALPERQLNLLLQLNDTLNQNQNQTARTIEAVQPTLSDEDVVD